MRYLHGFSIGFLISFPSDPISATDRRRTAASTTPIRPQHRSTFPTNRTTASGKSIAYVLKAVAPSRSSECFRAQNSFNWILLFIRTYDQCNGQWTCSDGIIWPGASRDWNPLSVACVISSWRPTRSIGRCRKRCRTIFNPIPLIFHPTK